MHPIKTIYNFTVSIQLISLIIFIFYLIENHFDLVIPININYNIKIPNTALTIPIKFSYDFHFNYAIIIALVFGLFALYFLLSVTAIGSGINDEGNLSIKQLTAFLLKFGILLLPLLYLLGKSELTHGFNALVSLIILIIHIMNLFYDVGGESQ